MKIIKDTVNNIKPVDKDLMAEAQRRLDSLTKPKGSLGKLEEFARRIVGIRRSLVELAKKLRNAKD